MKRHIKNLFLLSALIAGLGWILADRVTAQTFTTLHSFSSTPPYPGPYTNSEGGEPFDGLVLSGDTLFGTANIGGILGGGTVFAINTNGSGLTNLHSFMAIPPYPGPYTNSDGANPYAALMLSGNTLYGVTFNGGNSGQGTVFALNIDGTSFTNLHTFMALSGSSPLTNSDGANPVAPVIVSGNTLYGTALQGGSSGGGVVFALSADGTSFTNLHNFTATSGPLSTNSDGYNPVSALVLSGNTLYGTAQNGGSSGNGTVFAVNTDGTGFTNLHSFTATSGSPSTNSDGANPSAGLILSDNTLYGTTYSGGRSGHGVVFAVNTGGTGFTNLHSFTAFSVTPPPTNSDGASPHAGLVLSGKTVYGTTHDGGSLGYGTVFAVTTDGTSFTNLHSFTALNYSTNSDGAYPYAEMVLTNNTLFGTTSRGGSLGNGTVFSISLGTARVPQLRIIRSEAQIVLTWPTNTAGFTLQSATNLAAPVIWTTVSPGPALVNGQCTVTNSISGTQQFYRLRL